MASTVEEITRETTERTTGRARCAVRPAREIVMATSCRGFNRDGIEIGPPNFRVGPDVPILIASRIGIHRLIVADRSPAASRQVPGLYNGTRDLMAELQDRRGGGNIKQIIARAGKIDGYKRVRFVFCVG